MGYAILKCEAVLFDLDGVLVDSSQCIRRHWQAWAEKHDLDLAEIMRVAHGMRTIDTMRGVAPRGLDVETEERLFHAHEVVDHDGVTVIEGADALLRSLPPDAWAVVTSGSLALALGRLAHVHLPVPGVMVTAEDVREGKPMPEPYLLGAERLEVAAAACVVIEDAPAGIQAGKSAGMRVIGVAATHAADALLEAGADVVVMRLADLRISGRGKGSGLTIQIEQ